MGTVVVRHKETGAMLEVSQAAFDEGEVPEELYEVVKEEPAPKAAKSKS